MLMNRNYMYMLLFFVVALFIHEMGHMLAFWMLGIPSYIEFAMFPIGPVLVTRYACDPKTLLDLWFVVFFGPFFAGMIMMLIGEFKSEAYIASVVNFVYAPYELINWMMLVGEEEVLKKYILFFIVVFVPAVFAINWALDKIEERNKEILEGDFLIKGERNDEA